MYAYAYSKYAYAYNWAAYAGPMHAYAYLSPETLIQTFSTSVSLFYFYLILCFLSLSFSIYLLFILHVLDQGFPLVFSLVYHKHAFT